MFRRTALVAIFMTAGFVLPGCASRSARPASEVSRPDDKLPVPLFQPDPVYPILARKEGVEGEITVGFIITQTGDVADPIVLEGQSLLLANAALEAVAQWKFTPATKKGKPVAARTVQVITFSLNEEPVAVEQTPVRDQVQAPP